MNKKLVLYGFLAVFYIAGVGTGAYLYANPYWVNDFVYQQTSNYSYGGEDLQFSSEQIDLFSKTYDEKDEEFAYCLYSKGSKVVEYRFVPEVYHANESQITYESCDNSNGIVHSHPGYAGAPYPSEQDKETFLSSERDFMCIISGEVSSYERGNPRNLNCFDRDLNFIELSISHS